MAKKKQIYLVTLKENHKEIKPPACKIIIIAKIWIATEMTATTLNHLLLIILWQEYVLMIFSFAQIPILHTVDYPHFKYYI